MRRRVAGTGFIAFALRRLLSMAAVVILTPSLTFVVFGALRDERTLWAQAGDLPRYLSDTFLHLDFGMTGTPTQPQQISHYVLAGLPVDLALLLGGLVLCAVTGVTPAPSPEAPRTTPTAPSPSDPPRR